VTAHPTWGVDVLATTIERLPTVTLPVLPRMADFALWVTAAEPGLGWPTHSFVLTYDQTRRGAQETAVEASPIGPVIRTLAETGWTGTATELLERLTRDVPESARRGKDWPGTGRALAGALRRLAAPLRALGIDVSFGRAVDRGRTRLIEIEKTPDRPHRPHGPNDPTGAGFEADEADDPTVRPPSDCPSVTPCQVSFADDADDADAKIPTRSSLVECPRPGQSYLHQPMPTEGAP